MARIRKTCEIRGVVQGVGFRPGVYHLARKAGLGGWVQNRAGTVRLSIEGTPAAVDEFLRTLPANLPPNARIDAITEIETVTVSPCDALADFTIEQSTDTAGPIPPHNQSQPTPPFGHPSQGGDQCGFPSLEGSAPAHRSPERSRRGEGGKRGVGSAVSEEDARTLRTPAPEVVIPADLAICPDCRADIFQPGNRRYGYPFTTCTRCGPRYTVVNSTPYDRERTTMAAFPLCPDCRREYEAPANRRFHAESIACPRCGPSLWIEDSRGQELAGDAIRLARQEIARGGVVAVRGIGGFLLAADALNRQTLRVLRDRKRRPHKPFAVMGRSLEGLRRYVIVPPAAEPLLTSPESPIVILDIRAGAAPALPMDLLSPDTGTLGVMLPTSPLHELLVTPLQGDPTPAFDLLVMTSGNRRGEPICITNAEARQRLGDVADFLLCHDREINLRNDDSLCIIQHGAPQVWRRARGYAPNAVRLRRHLNRCTLAMGAEIKNTVALGFDDRVVLSPHVGDLEAPEALEGLERVAESLPAFLNRRPEAVAVDLHPDMHATSLGRSIAARLAVPVVEVQHHHAHAVAALTEHGHDHGLALVFDGTGLGTDGTIWGAELLRVAPDGYARLATFRGVPLPGGDAAVREPARQVVARWAAANVTISADWIEFLGMTRCEADVIVAQCRQGLNCPTTHAAGRVFDAFAALLGFAPRFITYEGQPAIRLEAAARRHGSAPAPELPFDAREEDGLFKIDWSEAFTRLADRQAVQGREAAWAAAVHRAIAAAAVAMVGYGLSKSPDRVLALSGGVFMNRILTDLLVPDLEGLGVKVLIHRQTPPNDGCISLGQAVVAGGAE